MRIERHANVAGCMKDGELINIFKDEISYMLGEPHPAQQAPGIYTKYVWCFDVIDENNKSVRCAIWDFFESDSDGQWSTYGPANVFSFIFGSHCVKAIDIKEIP